MYEMSNRDINCDILDDVGKPEVIICARYS